MKIAAEKWVPLPPPPLLLLLFCIYNIHFFFGISAYNFWYQFIARLFHYLLYFSFSFSFSSSFTVVYFCAVQWKLLRYVFIYQLLYATHIDSTCVYTFNDALSIARLFYLVFLSSQIKYQTQNTNTVKLDKTQMTLTHTHMEKRERANKKLVNFSSSLICAHTRKKTRCVCVRVYLLFCHYLARLYSICTQLKDENRKFIANDNKNTKLAKVFFSSPFFRSLSLFVTLAFFH